MIKPKSIIIPVCVGFALSSMVGLLAGVSFGIILLRALLFAVLSGILGLGIGILFQRFLLESPDIEGVPEGSGGPRQGSVVDLSVGDEPLVEDENSPDFYVRAEIPKQEVRPERSHKNAAAMPEEQHEEESASEDVASGAPQEQFVPVSLGTVVGESGSGDSVQKTAGDSDDILPEIGDISMDAPDGGDEISSGGMDFAIGNGMETSQSRGNAGVSSDSHTIAQAIRTVLARDS